LLDVGPQLFAGEVLVLSFLPALVRDGQVGPRLGEAILDSRLARIPSGLALWRRPGTALGPPSLSVWRRRGPRWERRAWARGRSGGCGLRARDSAKAAQREAGDEEAFQGAFLRVDFLNVTLAPAELNGG
jgi:hypothetical protein